MSIMDRRGREGREPEWQNEFATTEEWIAHVGQKFFSQLVPGAPFLLVARRLEYDGSGRHIPHTWMETSYSVGFLQEEGPLFGHVPPPKGVLLSESFFVGSRERISFPDLSQKGQISHRTQGPLEIIRNYQFRYTPVTETFKPPFVIQRSHDLFDKEVDAFSVACGVQDMDALAEGETLWDNRFLSWYSWSIQRLGIATASSTISTAQIEGHRGLLRSLHGWHAEVQSNQGRHKAAEARGAIKEWLTLAHEAGLDRQFDLLDVNGFRCQPGILLEDFRRLYPDE